MTTTRETDVNSGYVTMAAAGAALGGFLFGFDTSTMNSAIPGMRPTLQLSSGAVGFVAAVSLIGAAVGAWFAGPLATRFGRTRVMLVAGCAVLLGSVVVAFSSEAY